LNNQGYIEQGSQVVMNTYARFPLAPVKGEGCYFWDADGKKYLDFLSGIAVSALGHCHPALVQTIQQQAASLWHTSNLYWIPQQNELAGKLTALSGLGKAFFCNSGTEANEAAIKLVRKYFYRKGENRYEIIAFNHSFHGRTLAALTATAQPKYQEGFAPLVEGFVYAEFNDLPSVERLINERTAAILIEPVQGEGGVFPAEAPFLQGVKKLAEQHGLLLVFDEVQCGVSRSGTFFAYEQLGVKPDIVTLAKALAGGAPIGAMLASDEAASGFMPGDHAATFGGNPLVTAVACTLVDIVSAPAFLAQVQASGQLLRDKLKGLKDDRIVDIRGCGLMIGIEFDREVRQLVESLLEQGFVAGMAGAKVLRLVPPLIIGPAEIDQAMAYIAQGLEKW
jgi:predicted acetylornithine/succinylornithine family transaminase